MNGARPSPLSPPPAPDPMRCLPGTRQPYCCKFQVERDCDAIPRSPYLLLSPPCLQQPPSSTWCCGSMLVGTQLCNIQLSPHGGDVGLRGTVCAGTVCTLTDAGVCGGIGCGVAALQIPAEAPCGSATIFAIRCLGVLA